MAIKTGRLGRVLFAPTSPAILLVSINNWHIDIRTDFEDVSCFQDANRQYVPGLRDISGTFGGFWNNPGSKEIIDATSLSTPGQLELDPNSSEIGDRFYGLAYIDCAIDCSMQAPKISANFRAGGNWTVPVGSP